MTEAVALERVSHSYARGRERRRTHRRVLNDIELAVPEGSLFGLLGPNGAGKTTAIKIISTLLLATAGSVRVLGRDVTRSPGDVRRDIGLVLGGDRGLYDRLSGHDNLRYFAELYGLGGRTGARRIDEVLEIVEMADHRHTRVERYSRGMRQRLHIARGILHRPRLLLLDEPSIGVDPVGARRLRALVREVNRGGTTVVLTTHYMFEAEELVDRLAIVDRGRIVARGSVADIRRAARVGEVLEGPAPGLTEPELDRIRTHPATEGLEVAEHGGRQRVTLRLATGDDRRVQELTELLGSLGAGPIVRRGGTLEDAYVKLVQAGPGASGDPGISGDPGASVKDGSGTPA